MTPPVSPNPITISGADTDFQPEVFIISGIKKENRPGTACTSCPSSIWFDQDGWRCYCNVMKFLSWQGAGKPISSCDGRESSIAIWNEERAVRSPKA